MKKTTFIITLFSMCICISCTKKQRDEERGYGRLCWVIEKGDYFTTGRQMVNNFCDMTEEEFLNCDTCGYPGRVRNFVSACDYRDQGVNGPKSFYWEVKFPNATTYTGAYYATEKEASCYLGANGALYRKK
jgi:hypothetical protein